MYRLTLGPDPGIPLANQSALGVIAALCRRGTFCGMWLKRPPKLFGSMSAAPRARQLSTRLDSRSRKELCRARTDVIVERRLSADGEQWATRFGTKLNGYELQ